MADYPDANHHWTTVTGWNEDGSAFVGQMMEADFVPTRVARSKHFVCARCAYVGPESEFVVKGGKALCVTYGCAREDAIDRARSNH